MLEFITVLAIGFFVGLASTKYDGDEPPRFGYQSILWGFILIGWLGLTAGNGLGMRTVKIHGGRDPEYETVAVRKVPAEERWNRAKAVENTSFLPLALGIGASAVWIANARKRNWAKRTEREDNGVYSGYISVDPRERFRMYGAIWLGVLLFLWNTLSEK